VNAEQDMANSGMEKLGELQTWIYVSESMLPQQIAPAEVARIVHVSRIRNSELNVTGGLLYTGRRFAQLIEGSLGAVAALRQSIEADLRHRYITTIHYEPSAERRFQGWSLVYSGASRYMANLLDNVKLGRSAQQMAIEDTLVFLFEEFAAQETKGRKPAD
jgi:hypothetical protein